MTGNLAPDWYPDPGNPGIMRWWDGARWSGETRSAEAGPAPFGGIIPESTVTGETQHASWREPALQAWDAAYRAAGAAAVRDAFPVRAWVIGGAVTVVIAAVAAWFLIGLL